jgi:hypothetical protein
VSPHLTWVSYQVTCTVMGKLQHRHGSDFWLQAWLILD